jgi:Tol biopolymer transport system component
VLASLLSLLAANPAIALAAQSRPYTGVSFGRDGAGGIESFGTVTSIAVDQSSGDIYVYDRDTERIYKFDSAGMPVDFSSTGTNSFQTEASNGSFARQIAVASAGSIGGTEGDIYFVGSGQAGDPSVVAYAPSGVRLGNFGPNGISSEECGVAVDPKGRILVTNANTLSEYAPGTNPPTSADFVQAGSAPGGTSTVLCSLASDGTGAVYAARQSTDPSKPLVVYRFEEASDTEPTLLDFSSMQPSTGISYRGVSLAADPATGTVFVDDQGEVVEYAAGGSPELGAFGAGQISESFAVAVGAAADEVYVADTTTGKVKVFGSPVTVPTVKPGPTAFPTPVEADVTGSVDPEGTTVTECFVEYGPRVNEYTDKEACESLPPSDSDPHPVAAKLTGLEPDGVTYHYRLVAANADGTDRTPDQTFTTPSTVQTQAAEDVTETTATLTGRLFPDGDQYTGCEFEYEPVSEPGLVTTVECSPKANEIPADSAFHRVTANVTGLEANHVSYRVHLKATTAGGPIVGNAVTFATGGDPLISEVRAGYAGQHSGAHEPTIDPGGFPTTYRIEWGPTETYGHTATTGTIEPGEGPTRVFAQIGGLAEGTVYHYRVLASNASAHLPDESSLDHEVETLNGCGLPQGRCFELTSEREPGPVASPGHRIPLISTELITQAAEREGALAYVSESGYPGATRGAEVLYKAIRGPSSWSSTQLSPPITARDEQSNPISNSSRTLALSPELSCGVVESNQPLPGTTGRMSEAVEAGGTNLYRLNPDGSYTPISALSPENLRPQPPGAGRFFHIAGMSPDCGRIYFMSAYRYPGTGIEGREIDGKTTYLYEWREGSLQAVGFVPGGGSPVGASPGNDHSFSARADRNAVSEDGSRIFFTADRIIGKNTEEEGQPGLFVREDGTTTRDVSLSETSVPDTNPQYQWATPDGSKVYFTAAAGLTGESNTTGTDLYVYDLTKSASEHPLTDLSVNPTGEEAGVVGMVGASDDGSRVYFAATDRLVAREGLTKAENVSEGTYSLYLLEGAHLRFVATVKQPAAPGLLLSNSSSITSEVSPDGRYLLFESIPLAAGGEPAGVQGVYLFDAGASQEALTCVSCVPRGRTSKLMSEYGLLSNPGDANPETAAPAPRALVMRAGSPSVIFSSLDALAPGATPGQTNLYEWSHGQVFLLAGEPPDLPVEVGPTGLSRLVFSLGSDADASDIYLSTPETLTWEDGDGRPSVYDARIGGGFAEPAAPSPPCDPTVEGRCQRASAPPAAPPSPRSSGFVGPGNKRPKKCRKNQTKKRGRCVKKPGHKKHHGKHGKKHKRHANGNGGAGK